MKIISNTKDLEEFCLNAGKESFITVDLEFLREKTYFAKLCLIQAATISDSAIIDPLSKDISLEPFFQLMQNKNVVKVFHSCRQDIEILHNLTNQIPTPLFDTQIAAMVCGFGESVSYENLVSKVLGISLDKTSRLSDWSKRPLKDTQLNYALSDVTHLVNIYNFMKEHLEKTGRTSWTEEENEILSKPETYMVEPDNAWHKIRHRSHNAHFLTLLKELAKWRELRARKKDLPRQNVIKDDILLSIAAANPKDANELSQIRNIRKDIVGGKLAVEILDVLEKANKIPEKNWVKIEKEYKPSNGSSALFELLKLLLKIRSTEEDMVARLIADDDDLKNFSAFKDKDNPILKGWRYEIFGKDAVLLREGNLSIRFNKEKKSISIE